jgi:uroporphyrinogen-III synthase
MAKKLAAQPKGKKTPAAKTPAKASLKSGKKEPAKKTVEKPIDKKEIREKPEPEKTNSAPQKPVKAEKKFLVEEKPLPEIVNPEKLKPVKSILISQPKPESGKSPYIDIAEQFRIKLDWRPFTKVEGIKASDFRKQKIYIDQYSCIIFTSRVAIEQYFRICEELRIKVNEENRYFCLSEAIALYLQKFIQYRKRKVFYGDGKLPKLMEVILKHKEDGKFLLPCSDQRDKALVEALAKHNIPYSEAIIYNTVASDLSDLEDVKYDMLVFFNSSAIDSLYTNFPDFSQDETRLAIFGNSTADAVKGHHLNINIFAPTPENPSLVDAIKKYIIKANKKGK